MGASDEKPRKSSTYSQEIAGNQKLTDRQAEFVRQYLVDLNGTQAAIRAGYSPHTAQEQASRLLSNVKVQEAVAKAKAERAERTQITADRVLQEVARLAFADPRKFFREDGTVKHPTELDDDTATSLAQFEVLEEFAGSGENRMQIGFTKKVKWSDKKGPLELLMRHLGMLNDKMKLQGDAENPLTLLLQQVQGTALKPIGDE